MTNLQRIRKERGLSQRELAELSGVNLRMIQKYESGEKNINHAQAITLVKLSVALFTPIEALMQDIQDDWLTVFKKITAQNGTNKDL